MSSPLSKKPVAGVRESSIKVTNLDASNIVSGSGTAGTPVTYTNTFSSTPKVIVTNVTDSATLYVSASSTTGHTVTASAGTPTYDYIVIGTL